MLATTKQIQSLEKKISNLEDRIFKKKDRHIFQILQYPFLSSSWLGYTRWGETVEPKPREEDFFDNLEKIEKRQALIMKHLGLEFKQIKTTPEHETIMSTKKRVGRPSTK